MIFSWTLTGVCGRSTCPGTQLSGDMKGAGGDRSLRTVLKITSALWGLNGARVGASEWRRGLGEEVCYGDKRSVRD
jgi:hypothetical protein